MAKKKSHVGRSLEEYIREQKSKDLNFAVEFDRLKLARRIRLLREEQLLTQMELASRSHTTQSAIARLESGRVIPKIDLLHRIATSLGMRLKIEFSKAA